MGSFTLTDVGKFPAGTSISVYKAEQGKSGQGPSGSAETSGTMGDSSVTFENLENNREYVAYALVGSEHRYQAFKSDSDDPVVFSDRGRIQSLEERLEQVDDGRAWHTGNGTVEQALADLDTDLTTPETSQLFVSRRVDDDGGAGVDYKWGVF